MKALLIGVSVPCGVFVFLNYNDDGEEHHGTTVSVPCGVFVFLNQARQDVEEEYALFPSPAGSSYFSIAH